MTGGWGGGSRDGAARSENHAKGVDIIMSQTCISSLRRSVYHHSAGVYLIDSEGIVSHHAASVHNQDTCINLFEQLCCSNIVASFGLLTVKRRVSSVEDR